YAVVVQTSTPGPATTTLPSDKLATAPNTLAPGAANAVTHSYLLYSTDGSSWKKTDLQAVGAPANAAVASTSVGADHIDVTYQTAVAGAGGNIESFKLTTLVGTPKA